MNVTRAATNPLIHPAHVTPSRPDMHVVGAFNPAAARYGDETVLLVRIAEAVSDVDPDNVAVPIVRCNGSQPCLQVERVSRATPGADFSDTRIIRMPDTLLLTSLSHLRVARSTDHVSFTVDDHPALYPATPFEEYGLEDPRITCIDDVYYITYTAVSRWGIAVGLASTVDFTTFVRHGLIFGPENKDVVLFPERINGRYYALHRPSFPGLGELQVWITSSPDLFYWGQHRPLLEKRPGFWDSARIGAGDVPIKTPEGWLTIYHGVSPTYGYALGAALLDLDDPSRVLARSAHPVLMPEAPYETDGFFDKVVFACGSVHDVATDLLHIYYGAADSCTCSAWVPMAEVLDSLRPVDRRNFFAH